MINAVGRDIPESVLALGYEPYKGANSRDGQLLAKQGPKTRICEKPQETKIVESIREAIVKCGLKDGMTVSFHHHFRDGDYIVNMVMKEVVALGIKDITIAASSLGSAHDPVAQYIEDGIVTGIQTSGIRGKMGDVVSRGKLKTPAILRSHGGRVRAIEEGKVHIDVAFIGAPTSDEYGNCRALGGKSDCGVLSYAVVDSEYADKVVVITDTLVPYPNFPASIHGINVDYVVKVDEIGNPKKIASAAARMTQNPRDLMMAEATAKVVCANDPAHVISETVDTVYTVTVKPTCTEPGKAVYTAGFNNKRFYGQTKEVPIDALGHDYVDHAAQAPTCTEPGWEAYRTCTRCDYTSYKELAALGHALTLHEALEPTETAAGNVAYYSCGVCNKLFADAAGKTGITPEDTVLPPVPPVFTLGDVNADGLLKAEDARLALRAAVKLEPFWNDPQSAAFKAADTNGDGKVSADDARRILRASVKLEDPKDWQRT